MAAYPSKLRPDFVPIERSGADFDGAPNKEERHYVEGKDYPKGIELLDVDWFLEQTRPEAIVACRTDEALRDLRTKVEMALWIRSLKAKAKGD